jgi:HAE1 family hydrophobic/amphiphilic exporter-1
MSMARRIVKRPVLGLVVFGLTAVVALYLVSGLAIDMFPEIDMPILTVTTVYRGAGPETVEKAVTKPLESQLVNLSGLSSITSSSAEGRSTIVMEFDYGADLDAKANDVRDRIDRVRSRLPDEADSPSIRQFDTNTMPILRIAVKGKTTEGSLTTFGSRGRTQNELRRIALDAVQDRLEQVDGVASTNVVGGQEQEVRVEISQNRLEAYGLTITGIAGILAAQNIELGAGTIVDGARNYSIRTAGEYTSVQDIAETVIARRNGADIRLMDAAVVNLAYPGETSTVYINGEASVYVGVIKQSGANSAATAEKVYAKLDEIQALLPAGVALEIVRDNTTQIRDMIKELVNSAVLGAALAMAVLLLFLRDIKSTVIIGLSIPFSILVTLLFMKLAGLTLNMLTLAGLILGVGMIVDSSIVILENIFKYRERGAKSEMAAILGSHEVMSSIVSSTLTTLCVFVPIFLFKSRLGMLGELFQGLSFTVGIALASSLLVAVFLVPILAGKYLPLQSRKQNPIKNKALSAIDRAIEGAINGITEAYSRLLSGAVQHRLVTLVLVSAAFAGSVLVFPRLGMVLIPPMNEDSVSLSVELPQGTRYEDTRAVMLQLQEIAVGEIKGAKNIIVSAGSSGGANLGELQVNLDMNDPAADRSAQVMAKLRAHFNDFPGVAFSFGQGLARVLAGGSDIDIALRADNIDDGLAAAREIAELIKANVPQLSEISIDTAAGLPQVEVVIDRQRAYDLGVTIGGAANEIAVAMNGLTATTFRQGGGEYPVTLVLREEDRTKLPDLERIFAASGTGKPVSLSNFARLEKGLGPVSIKRENQSRMIHISGNVIEGQRINEVEERIRELIGNNFILPEGMVLSYEGQWREITENNKTFALIITLAVLLVFGVMAGQYESFKDPLINLCTIPLMLIGVAGIYLLTGQNLSMLSMAGMVMLAGIVVNNGIILVDYTNLLVGRGVPAARACIEAGKSRLRPVLMTTLTTILGLIPMAFFPGKSAAMIQPIGLTVAGGLASSTLITLFFIPVMYSLVNEGRRIKGKICPAGF